MSLVDDRRPTTDDRSPGLVRDTSGFGRRSSVVGRQALYAILAAYAGLCLFYNLVTPIGEGPDEMDHIRYVEHLVRYGHFPAIGTGSSERPYTIEAKQPPAYYLGEAALMLALGRAGKQIAPELQTDLAFRTNHVRYQHPPVPADLLPWVYIMRMVGMLCGLGAITIIFATVREVLPGEKHAPLAVAAAGMGLLPQFIFMSSVVNNDNLAILVGAAISYLMVRPLMRGIEWRWAILLGVALGIGLLTKTNLLVYIPIGLFALALCGLPPFQAKHGRREWTQTWWAFVKRRVPVLVVVGVVMLLVGGWWIGRNYLKYGDPLATNAVAEMATQVFPSFIKSVDPGLLDVQFQQLVFTTDTHFGFFGWESIRLPEPFYWVYYALLLLAIVGLVRLAVKRDLEGRQAACLMLAVLVFELFYASLIRHGAWRGRLLFPALASTGLLVVTGTYYWIRPLLRGRFAPYAAHAVAGMWLGFLVVSNIVALFGYIAPTFYR